LQWDAAGAELPEWQSVLADDANARFGFGLRLFVDGIAAHRGAEREPVIYQLPKSRA
jgi:hypothetical protein